MKTIAIIPARGGSKGIKSKNIRDLCGKPLIYYQLKNALDCPNIDEVVLASDSDEILSVGRQLFGNQITVIKRPPEISTDDSKTEETLLYVLNKIKGYGIVVTLEPTNPLNKTKYIDACITKLLDSQVGVDAVCCAINDYSFWLSPRRRVLERPMKENITPVLKERGNCWATKIESLQKYKNRMGHRFEHIIIPKEDTCHIDSYYDWVVAEVLMKQRLIKTPGRYYTAKDKRTEEDLYDVRYWKTVVDPDGKCRDKTEERDKRVASCKEELDYINGLPPGKVLDVGCGLGFLLSGIDDSWDKHGVEISEYGAKHAQQFGKVLCGVLRAADYESDSFDVVLCYHVIEHMKNPIDELIEMKRILKPGGKLVLGTPDFGCGLAKRFGDNFRLLKDDGHISFFDAFSLFRLLTDLFFQVENVSFPFFDTEYFTEENLRRLLDTTKISPPFYGNFITFYASKK